MVFQGSCVALITPFTETGVDFEALGRLIEFQIANGTNAILIAGTTGEPSTMTKEEKHEVMRFALSKIAGRVPVLMGTGGNNTAAVVEESRFAEALGASALLVVTPYYNKCTQNGLVAHYNAVCDSVGIPVIAYNVPGRTGVNISPAAFAKMAEHPNLGGIKEASGNIAYMTETAALLRDDFAMWSGNDDMTVAAMALGACGVISVMANFLPFVMHEMTENCLAGNFAAARAMQLRYLPLMRSLFSDVNPIPVKEAMNYLGFEVGGFRLPLCSMSEVRRNRLVMELERLEDIPWKKHLA